MTTEKPKVSAYVPSRIKEQLKDFCKLNDLSESAALTAILAKYFGYDRNDLEGVPVAPITVDTLKRIDEIFNRLIAVEERTAYYPKLKTENIERIVELERKVEVLQRQLNDALQAKNGGEDILDPLNRIFEKHYGNGKTKKMRSCD